MATLGKYASSKLSNKEKMFQTGSLKEFIHAKFTQWSNLHPNNVINKHSFVFGGFLRDKVFAEIHTRNDNTQNCRIISTELEFDTTSADIEFKFPDLDQSNSFLEFLTKTGLIIQKVINQSQLQSIATARTIWVSNGIAIQNIFVPKVKLHFVLGKLPETYFDCNAFRDYGQGIEMTACTEYKIGNVFKIRALLNRLQKRECIFTLNIRYEENMIPNSVTQNFSSIQNKLLTMLKMNWNVKPSWISKYGTLNCCDKQLFEDNVYKLCWFNTSSRKLKKGDLGIFCTYCFCVTDLSNHHWSFETADNWIPLIPSKFPVMNISAAASTSVSSTCSLLTVGTGVNTCRSTNLNPKMSSSSSSSTAVPLTCSLPTVDTVVNTCSSTKSNPKMSSSSSSPSYPSGSSAFVDTTVPSTTIQSTSRSTSSPKGLSIKDLVRKQGSGGCDEIDLKTCSNQSNSSKDTTHLGVITKYIDSMHTHRTTKLDAGDTKHRKSKSNTCGSATTTSNITTTTHTKDDTCSSTICPPLPTKYPSPSTAPETILRFIRKK